MSKKQGLDPNVLNVFGGRMSGKSSFINGVLAKWQESMLGPRETERATNSEISIVMKMMHYLTKQLTGMTEKQLLRFCVENNLALTLLDMGVRDIKFGKYKAVESNRDDLARYSEYVGINVEVETNNNEKKKEIEFFIKDLAAYNKSIKKALHRGKIDIYIQNEPLPLWKCGGSKDTTARSTKGGLENSISSMVELINIRLEEIGSPRFYMFSIIEEAMRNNPNKHRDLALMSQSVSEILGIDEFYFSLFHQSFKVKYNPATDKETVKLFNKIENMFRGENSMICHIKNKECDAAIENVVEYIESMSKFNLFKFTKENIAQLVIYKYCGNIVHFEPVYGGKHSGLDSNSVVFKSGNKENRMSFVYNRDRGDDEKTKEHNLLCSIMCDAEQEKIKRLSDGRFSELQLILKGEHVEGIVSLSSNEEDGILFFIRPGTSKIIKALEKRFAQLNIPNPIEALSFYERCYDAGGLVLEPQKGIEYLLGDVLKMSIDYGAYEIFRHEVEKEISKGRGQSLDKLFYDELARLV